MTTASFPVQVVIRAVNLAAAPIRAVATQVASLSGPARSAMQAIAQSGVPSALEGAARSAGKLGSALGGVGDRVRNLVGPAAALTGAFSAAGAVRAASNYATLGDTAQRMALQLGAAVAPLQRLEHGAQVTGSSASALHSTLDRVQNGIADVATGQNDNLAALFRHLGIEARDANGQIRTSIDLMPDLAEAFRKNENQGVRKKMAEALGVDESLIPMMSRGRAGLAALADEAQRFGVVLDDEATKAASDFALEQRRLSAASQGLLNVVGAQLLPVMRPIIEALREWIVANRDLIGQRVAEAVSSVAAAFREIDLNAVLDGVTGFFRAMKDGVDFIGGWRNALIAVAVVMNAGLIVSIVQLTGAMATAGFAAGALAVKIAMLTFGQAIAGIVNFVTALRAGYGAMAAFNLILAANPIGAVIVAVTALAGAAYLIYENWEPIGRFMSDVWETIRSSAEAAFGWIDEKLASVIASVRGAVATIAGLLPTGLANRLGLGDLVAGGSRDSLIASAARAGVVGNGLGAGGGQLDVKVRFDNAPPGTRVEADGDGVEPDIAVGYSLGMGIP